MEKKIMIMNNEPENQKASYIKPELTVKMFATEDIITASTGTAGDDNTGRWPGSWGR